MVLGAKNFQNIMWRAGIFIVLLLQDFLRGITRYMWTLCGGVQKPKHLFWPYLQCIHTCTRRLSLFSVTYTCHSNKKLEILLLHSLLSVLLTLKTKSCIVQEQFGILVHVQIKDMSYEISDEFNMMLDYIWRLSKKKKCGCNDWRHK